MTIIQELILLEQESLSRGIPIIKASKGEWLLNKTREINAKKVLELGTANGYSGIILANNGAKLTTIEQSIPSAREAAINFSKHNIKANIIIGDGVEEIKKLKKEFDLIFIDFAARDYIKVLEDAISLVRINGYIIADNISFEKCKDYKESILNHPKLETQIEGDLAFSRKINL
tara:strand:- start:2533 stop:3054 length:522 start_codon:yes stop_codon:yes gene_type:complete